jgi:16S rRNA (guanine527-N7)-methyltransferase
VWALGASDRATVVHADLESLGHHPDWRGQFDAATARGVAPPPEVAELVVPLLAPGGVLIVSVAGTGEAWSATGLSQLDARICQQTEGLIVIEAGHCPPPYPRRRRTPHLFVE